MNSDSEKNITISPLGKSIIKTLAYYDIFDYPLTSEEIFYNLETNHVSLTEVLNEIEKLFNSCLVYKESNFYLLRNKKDFVDKRLAGNELAEKRMKSAYRMSKFISKFPYVRAILLSGSISKGYMEKESDIDYFIITHPNRLWFTRLVLMLFKKTFLFNSRKMFCINYFVDTETLEIEEKNIFTATELATLIPTYGSRLYDELHLKNYWVKDFYPNFPKRNTITISENKSGGFKYLCEKLFNKKIGDKLDDFSMSLFEKSNQKKYRDYNSKDFQVAFKTSKRESKHHPKFFQKRVLEAFNDKLKSFENNYNVTLD
jgi:predicted nucleotidyltransferase